MNSVLVFSENPRYLLDSLYPAYLLSEEKLDIIALTSYSKEIEEISSKGFKKVYLTKEKLLMDSWEDLISRISIENKVKHIVSVSLKNHIDILSRYSAKKNILMFTDINFIEIKNNEVKIIRKILGGKASSIIKINKENEFVLTVPLKKFKPIEKLTKPEIIYLEKIKESNLKILGYEKKEKSALNIEEAEIVVGVGRGFKKKEDLKLAFEFANLINAQVGCTRPLAADYKWLPEDSWIGISSKTIRPKIYFAIGISGAPQHVSSILDSKIIVAINKDKNAAIFNYSDYGIVADLYQFLPILIKKIKEMKGKL